MLICLSIKDLINMNKLKRIQVVMGLIIIIVVMFVILSVNFLWPKRAFKNHHGFSVYLIIDSFD